MSSFRGFPNLFKFPPFFKKWHGSDPKSTRERGGVVDPRAFFFPHFNSNFPQFPPVLFFFFALLF